ncbi:hypothetical protein [Bdellovibrio bacteriovorus]|uniref:hypothetical protein n=1 Tax=Bdellovibrio bacteriovorus TaxID=959 RepID=UPI000B13DA99|nr:hypothetical protein [Bdellovibrio bacteriovorus]
MRLSVMVLSAVLLVSPLTFAGGGKSQYKKLAKQCRQEGVAKADIKKCVKEKQAANK